MSGPSPVVATYAVDERYPLIDGGTGRPIGMQPFTPPAVGEGPCCWRPMTVPEFQTYYDALLSGIDYDKAWVAETLATGSCPPTPTYVVGAGIAYLSGRTYGVWTGASWSVSGPPKSVVFPSWMSKPKFDSFPPPVGEPAP